MFRPKRSLKIGYNRQGYIYFYSKLYPELPEGKKRQIEELCRRAAKDPAVAAAVLRYVTSDDTATKICLEYSISRSTLERAIRRYYNHFPRAGR